MSKVQKVPAMETQSRPETGPMQFGDDWPGIFIRGDNALFYAHALALALNMIQSQEKQDWMVKAYLDGLAKLLLSCQVKPGGDA